MVNTIRKYWALSLLVGFVVIAGLVNLIGGDDTNNTTSNNTPTATTVSRVYGSCEEARVARAASMTAKVTLKNEGRLSDDLLRFHNLQITESSNYLNANC